MENERKFWAEMFISQALAAHFSAAEVFTRFGLACCTDCMAAKSETVRMACEAYNIDLEALLLALNSLEIPS